MARLMVASSAKNSISSWFEIEESRPWCPQLITLYHHSGYEGRVFRPDSIRSLLYENRLSYQSSSKA